MRAPKRLQTLVLDLVERGAAGTGAREDLSACRLGLVSASDVNWSNPVEPAVPAMAVEAADSKAFWSRISEAHPTWLNLAWYRTSETTGCLVIEHNTAPERCLWSDPGLSVSFGPRDVYLVIQGGASDD